MMRFIVKNRGSPILGRLWSSVWYRKLKPISGLAVVGS
jgi:hypothetical protein